MPTKKRDIPNEISIVKRQIVFLEARIACYQDTITDFTYKLSALKGDYQKAQYSLHLLEEENGKQEES